MFKSGLPFKHKLNAWSTLPNAPNCDLEKSSSAYKHGINFWKIKWFKVFRKTNFFLFSDREFYADQKYTKHKIEKTNRN